MNDKKINRFLEARLKKYNLKDVKNFISRRANEKLAELGYSPIFEYDIESANQLEWFYHLTGGLHSFV